MLMKETHNSQPTSHNKKKTGVLMVNLGTPDSPEPKDVYKYLIQFLTDGRVIDIPTFRRNLLVRGIIVPFRYKKSAKSYAEIWEEQGSPLMYHSVNLTEKVRKALGDDYHVVLAMRYQNPGIEAGLNELKKADVERLIILPLFPQYASATTGSIHQEVMEHVKNWEVIPNLTFINSYYDHPKMIGTFAEIGAKHQPEQYDHVLFSFHGLPERQIYKADQHNHCLKEGCCATISHINKFCYRAQCFATARAIAEKLHIEKGKYTVCFQSRLGKTPWIQPYANETIEKLAHEGKKKILAFSPAFVADCLETIFEIGVEYDEEFKEMGGEKVQLVESLNDHPKWVETVVELVKQA